MFSLRKLLLCGFLLLPASLQAGNASSPEEALKIIANKIEAGDLNGVLPYFSGDPKNLEVLRDIINDPKAKKQFSNDLRNVKLKRFFQTESHEKALPKGWLYEYDIPSIMEDGKSGYTSMSVCGYFQYHEWAICNW